MCAPCVRAPQVLAGRRAGAGAQAGHRGCCVEPVSSSCVDLLFAFISQDPHESVALPRSNSRLFRTCSRPGISCIHLSSALRTVRLLLRRPGFVRLTARIAGSARARRAPARRSGTARPGAVDCARSSRASWCSAGQGRASSPRGASVRAQSPTCARGQHEQQHPWPHEQRATCATPSSSNHHLLLAQEGHSCWQDMEDPPGASSRDDGGAPGAGSSL